MSVIGIVCEFNPFHNGHKYLIDTVKKEPDDIVVAVMSGNYVQRAEPALFPKEIRVKAALSCGVDIVLELPFLYATASAEIFAENAVRILDSFGCDRIAFGTENTELSLLEKAVDIICMQKFDEELKNELSKGVSYPAARQAAFDKYGIECDISLPNNILAIEYLKAVKKLNSRLVPMAVSRMGAGYNDNFAVGEFASATHIRNLIENSEAFKEFVPDSAFELYDNAINSGSQVSRRNYNIAVMSILRGRLDDCWSQFANMAEGLDNRIKTAVINCNSLNEIYDSAKTKRYTHSRVRRAVLSTAMGVTERDMSIKAPYCRLLGFNANASKVLGDLARACKLPFTASYNDILNIGSPDAKRVFELENKSSNIYNLFLQNTVKASTEMTYMPLKMK
ncbi:MAG: nucleotidyltransferase family protein [Candidatus Fimenecus sp.]